MTWLNKLLTSSPPILIVLISAILLKLLILDRYFPDQIVYTSATLQYNKLADINIRKYAIKDEFPSFLFAPLAPENLNPGLKFNKHASIAFLYRGEFNPNKCRDSDDVNHAFIEVKGANTYYKSLIVDGETKILDLDVEDDEIISIILSNKQNPECGRARITLLEKQNASHVLFLFIVIWVFAVVLCNATNISPLIALFGAGTTLLFLSADAGIGDLASSNFWFCIYMALALTALLLVIVSLGVKSKITNALLAFLLLLCFCYPIALLGHKNLFGFPVSQDSIHAILQSNIAQSIEFWEYFIGIKRTIGVLIFGVALYFFIKRINSSKTANLTAIVLGIAILVMSLPQLALNSTQSSSIQLIKSATAKYREEVEILRKLTEKRKSFPVEADLKPQFENNLSVILIGESVNKNHMSAYGYPRKTTPNIDERIKRREVIKFSNVYSNHTHSNPTVSYMLTSANQYNEKNWLKTASIFGLTKAAGLNSTWISNHRMLGGWSNQITVLAKEADQSFTINKKVGKGNSANHHDGAMLPILNNSITTNSKQVIFLHLYNSHWNYCNRYPSSVTAFNNKEVSQIHFGTVSSNRKVSTSVLNCYDNTILYTDKLLEEIITILEKRQQPSILVYLADHADDVFRARAHNQAVYTYEMSEVPLFIWANQDWRVKNSEIWQTLNNHKDYVFTNDLMFETVLGLVGITSSVIDKKQDLSSNVFRQLDTPLSLHGRIRLNSPENILYWQRQNVLESKRIGIELRALNIDSILKAKYAIDLGLQVLQLNTQITNENQLVVTDSTGKALGITLAQFLDELDAGELKKVLIKTQGVDDLETEKRLKMILVRLQKKYSFDIRISDYKATLAHHVLSATDFSEIIHSSKKNKVVSVWVTLTPPFH